jgi:hypothetical protein
MNKIGIITGVAAIAALLPAGIGLAANPSLSARVPVSPAQVELASGRPATSPDDHGGRRGSGSDDPSPVSTRTSTRPATTSADDHGGSRRGGSGKGGSSGGGSGGGGSSTTGSSGGGSGSGGGGSRDDQGGSS